MLCVHQEGWDREGGREKQEGGDMGIYVYADSFCYTAETNTPLQSSYTPIKMLKNKENSDFPRKMDWGTDLKSVIIRY